MYQVFETIKVHQHRVFNLSYHVERMKKTAAFLSFRLPSLHHLEEQILNHHNGHLQKARILYNEKDLTIELQNYSPRHITQFISIKNDTILYPYKFTNREQFKLPSYLKLPSNEPLFIKNNQFTDSGYANIVFLKNNVWFTPESPLLLGTKRQYYLDHQLIQLANISLNNFSQFSHIGLINAMLDLGECVLPISTIQLPQ